MTTFTTFDLPAHSSELSDALASRWSEEMVEHAQQFAFTFSRYFDPTATDAPPDPRKVSVVWSASPARLLAQFTDPERWARADSTRDEQDEYCEWRTTRREDGKLTSVVFTTEVPEYWALVAENDPDQLVEMYRRWVDPAVQLSDLLDDDNQYMPDNKWNHATSTHATHLRQGSNTLLAAIRLAAEATVQRVDSNGNRVTDRRELVVCGGLGEPLRNSDPQIADIVNDAVAAGSMVSLANPLGLYLDGVQVAGFITPDGADAAVESPIVV